MDLPNLLTKLKSEKQEPQKFVAVEIGFDTVKVALWQSVGGHTEVTSIGSTQTWTGADSDELLSAIDTSFADAQGSVIDDSDKVIFGLPETWVDHHGIVEAQKPLLKSICKKFNFHPIGFVVTTEAVAHYLRDVEGGPPSAILIQIYANQIAVSLIYLGKLEATQIVERSTSLTSDIEEGLGRIPHTGHLPARIILMTNQDDPEPVKQELISYDWQKRLSFLHLPKVETLPKEWSIKAVAVAGGSEVIAAADPDSNPSELDQPADPIEPSESLEPSEPPEPHAPAPEPPPSLGFTPVDLSSPPTAEIDNLEPPSPAEVVDVGEVEPPQPTRPTSRPVLAFLSRIKFPPIKFPVFSPRSAIMFIIPAILIGLGVAGFVAYRTFPRAEIDAYVDMKSYQQQISFQIDPNISATDFEANLLAGQKSNQDISGTKTIATTGTRQVGDRAKGKVIIYNRTSAPRTFKAGTSIKANGLKFTLDAAVTVASASSKENADFSVTIEPSKVESLATAADIGDKYNLPKDTQFMVENFADDTFFAVAGAAFAGGSARSVAAVSATDITQLKAELIKELQAGLVVQTSSSGGESLGQISVGDPEISQEDYSAEKNQEADQLTLNLSLNQSVYQYNPSDLSVLAQQMAVKSLPENSQIKPDSTNIKILSATVDDQNRANVTADIVLYYIPRIDASEYAKELIGLPLDQLPAKLAFLPGFLRYELAPKYLIFNRLPMSENQISLRIKTDNPQPINP